MAALRERDGNRVASSDATIAPPGELARNADGNADRARDPLYVSSVEKGIRVLQAFRNSEASLSLTEIAEKTGLGKSAAQRFCHTLTTLGFLQRDERTRHLKPSPRLLELSYVYLASDHVISIAAPFLLKVREKCGEAVNLARPLDYDVVYVVRLPSLGAALTSPLVGGRAPIFCTASGRSYLSTLPQDEAEAIIDTAERSPLTRHTITDRRQILDRVAEARETGYAIAVQECIYGEITIGAPIRGKGARGVGAINICMTVPTWSEANVRAKLAPIITHAAHEISQTIAASPSG